MDNNNYKKVFMIIKKRTEDLKKALQQPQVMTIYYDYSDTKLEPYVCYDVWENHRFITDIKKIKSLKLIETGATNTQLKAIKQKKLLRKKMQFMVLLIKGFFHEEIIRKLIEQRLINKLHEMHDEKGMNLLFMLFSLENMKTLKYVISKTDTIISSNYELGSKYTLQAPYKHLDGFNLLHYLLFDTISSILVSKRSINHILYMANVCLSYFSEQNDSNLLTLKAEDSFLFSQKNGMNIFHVIFSAILYSIQKNPQYNEKEVHYLILKVKGLINGLCTLSLHDLIFCKTDHSGRTAYSILEDIIYQYPQYKKFIEEDIISIIQSIVKPENPIECSGAGPTQFNPEAIVNDDRSKKFGFTLLKPEDSADKEEELTHEDIQPITVYLPSITTFTTQSIAVRRNKEQSTKTQDHQATNNDITLLGHTTSFKANLPKRQDTPINCGLHKNRSFLRSEDALPHITEAPSTHKTQRSIDASIQTQNATQLPPISQLAIGSITMKNKAPSTHKIQRSIDTLNGIVHTPSFKENLPKRQDTPIPINYTPYQRKRSEDALPHVTKAPSTHKTQRSIDTSNGIVHTPSFKENLPKRQDTPIPINYIPYQRKWYEDALPHVTKAPSTHKTQRSIDTSNGIVHTPSFKENLPKRQDTPIPINYIPYQRKWYEDALPHVTKAPSTHAQITNKKSVDQLTMIFVPEKEEKDPSLMFENNSSK